MRRLDSLPKAILPPSFHSTIPSSPELTIVSTTMPEPSRPIPQKATPPPSVPAGFAHLTLDTFSPVNQNGSYEFDRVLKSGYVQKRTRKTKSWKQIYLVLRPNYLSIYKDKNEEKLRKKIVLEDLTTVALLKDPKQKRQHVFGLFSPSRNYHFDAGTEKDVEEWVDLLRREARIEEEEEEMLLASPGGKTTATYRGFDQNMQQQKQRILQDERLASSSPEPSDHARISGPRGLNIQRRESHTMDYSGNEVASQTDLSDGGAGPSMKRTKRSSVAEEQFAVQPLSADRPILAGRNISQASGFDADQHLERVVWQGYLLALKSKGGVRQWKNLWMVVRPRNFALYKNESEYSPLRIVPLASVINAVEIDPLSKTKKHCLQIITEEKSYKFCVQDEDALDKSLGAFKSLLAKRKN